jgi:hypothetical protein
MALQVMLKSICFISFIGQPETNGEMHSLSGIREKFLRYFSLKLHWGY